MEKSTFLTFSYTKYKQIKKEKKKKFKTIVKKRT